MNHSESTITCLADQIIQEAHGTKQDHGGISAIINLSNGIKRIVSDEPIIDDEPKTVNEPKIEDVRQEAEDAFWAVVADKYPHIQTGDFPPDAAIDIHRAMEQAIQTWLSFNDPNFK